MIIENVLIGMKTREMNVNGTSERLSKMRKLQEKCVEFRKAKKKFRFEEIKVEKATILIKI